MSDTTTADILVIGSGAAGLTAALQAKLLSPTSTILVIDKCPPEWAGGNGHFTAGAYRTAHSGLPSLLPLVSNCPPDLAAKTDVPAYTAEDFTADMLRVTGGRCDPALTKELVEGSYEAVKWLYDNAQVNWQLSYKRQAYFMNERYRFWGGLHLTVEDGGKGLIRSLLAACKKAGVILRFNTAAKALVTSGGAISGLDVQDTVSHASSTIPTRAVIMCAGGFEASASLRTSFLGPGWDLAFVRGTPFNTGDLLTIAQRDVAAATAGNWSGCHSVAWDAHAPADTGDREISNEFTKSGYPLGLMLNATGQRFVDEGIDMRNYTYAKFGRAILQQPQGIAFQVYDSRVLGWLRDEEYRDERVTKIKADSLEDLAKQLTAGEGLEDAAQFVETVKAYNAAVAAHGPVREQQKLEWDPSRKDGLATVDLSLAKSNWALPLDKPPFVAVKVASGITFTFGGLRVDPKTAGVVSKDSQQPVKGLWAAGEMVGGLFYGNYPGGSGLTQGAVFGRKAAREAVGLVNGEGAAGAVRARL